MQPRVLIITGYGLNCEAESVEAWKRAGAQPLPVHLNDLLLRPTFLRECDALMFIGGFSYGDHMGSGHVLAHRVKHHLGDQLQEFVQAGKLILGVCNGFQVMVKMGLLPGLGRGFLRPQVALLQNECGAFQDRWVHLVFDRASPCVFTRGLERMDLPVRHGEGRFFVPGGSLRRELQQKHLIPCRYADPATGRPTDRFPWNPNGSWEAAAGLCDPSGRIFGLMPHPEAFLFRENHPCWDHPRWNRASSRGGQGLEIFRNAVAYLRG